MKLCADCAKKHPNYHPIKYALGACDDCGRYVGVAECEYKKYDMPEGWDKLFNTKK